MKETLLAFSLAAAAVILMTFALYWVGQPVASPLAAVVVYRVFNFVLPTVPALIACRSVGSVLDNFYERGTKPARGPSRRKSAPHDARPLIAGGERAGSGPVERRTQPGDPGLHHAPVAALAISASRSGL